jgi:YVTN family beta-propeller protein
LLLTATGISAEEPVISTPARAYVTNELSGDLSVIDLATRQTIATVPLGKRPRGISPSPDGRLLYIALSGSPIGGPGVDESKLPPPDKGADGIGVFDVAQNRLVKVLRGVSDPENVAVGPAGDRLYIASEDTGQLVIMDAGTGAIVARVAVGEEPEGVAVSPDGELALITSETDSSVSIVETRTQQVRHKVKVGDRPRNVLFAAGRAFLPGENDASVTAIDPIAGKVLWRLVVAGELVRPMGMAVAGPAIFVTTGRGGELVRLDPRLGSVTGRVKVGVRPWGAASTPDGRHVLTANGPSNDVSLVDAGTLEVVARYPAGNRPWGVAILRPPTEDGR